MIDSPSARPVQVTVETSDPDIFNLVLQQGFMVAVRTGCSLKDLLCGQFAIEPAFVDSRIQTAFINNRPVDDFAGAPVHDNDVVALSAAMPGLVGATFRSGGILSPFRSSISFAPGSHSSGRTAPGRITVKLFNLLARELGPVFLARGICIDAPAFQTLFQKGVQTPSALFAITAVNGREIEPEQVKKLLDSDASTKIELRVQPGQANGKQPFAPRK